MEDFLDQVFLSGPRSEVSRSSYIGSAAGEVDGLLVDALRNVHGENDKNLQLNASPLTWESNVNASIVEENMYHWVSKGPLDDRIQLDRIAETGFNASSSAGYVHLPINLSSTCESNGNGPSAFEPSLNEYPVFSANWPSQYGAGSLPAPIITQERTNGYGLQGGVVGSDESITHDKLEYLGNLSTTLDQDDLQKTNLLNFTDWHIGLSGAAGGIRAQQKVVLSEETNSAAHYGNQITVSGPQSPTSATVGGQMVSKPRVRARRGQATDPHSIAERLRREKIAGRLKNLQELVPNSNKTDKASSLDEIIEYVKFLQHQVKILSMSRVGAAGAVLPLITDNQSEHGLSFPQGSRSLLQAAGGHVPDSPHSPDDVAFEQEVVKLMESNITSAMQFLQSKGLCLMPIALAAAMSSGKLSSNSQNSDWKKLLPPIGANDSVTGLHVNDSGSHEESGQKILINDCNGAVKPEGQKSKLK